MMKTKVVDTRGMLCPAPLIAVRKEINEAKTGDAIEVLTDNDTAYGNLVNYLSELGIVFECSKKDFVHVISFVRSDIEAPQGDLHCSVPTAADGYVVVLKSDVMGEGERELGEMLLRGYLNAISESDSRPSTIVIYNSGVKCAMKGNDTSDALKRMEAMGIEIVICGTCVDYYQLKEEIAVGVISNMYRISEILASARLVVYP